MDKKLQKAAENHSKYLDTITLRRNGEGFESKVFQAGANYQAEQTPFSEEDILDFPQWIDNQGFRKQIDNTWERLLDESYETGVCPVEVKTTKELLELYLKSKEK